MERVILHSDQNNFYASVECSYHPELRGKPLAVGGDVEQRHGIVLAKNYLAKAFGVQTGEALWEAKQKCPDIIFVPPDFKKYIKFSKLIREIYNDYTDKVENFGLDESWIELSGNGKDIRDGIRVADEIRARIKAELGITASVGVSFNKIFAKLGSDMKKPDATTVITRENFKEKIWKLPAKELLYVGRATDTKLNKCNIQTIGDLANTDVNLLKTLFGKNGEMLWVFANGLDNSPVSKVNVEPMIKSIGNSTTTPRDLVSDTDIKSTLYVLCESVAERLRDQNCVCACVQISVRDNELVSYERQGKLTDLTNVSGKLFDKAYELYLQNPPERPVRSIGVRACQLVIKGDEQMTFFMDRKTLRQECMEGTIDELRRRFGHYSIQRGIMLIDRKLTGFDPKSDHTVHPVAFLR